MQKRVFSGIQPTGDIHIGNYLGAIRYWVEMQQENADCLYCLVDQHAITVPPYDPAELRTNVRKGAAALVACGLKPEKVTLYTQSAVPGHAELAWILGCHTPLGWLNRMTQFKEKAGKQKDNASLGLYGYPVLQAADILLYKSTHVPIGEDQKQHLELSRDIAGAFNRAYGIEYFPLPEPIVRGETARVMSLRDGTKKMSKSDPSDYSRILLEDDADTIALKIRKAKSDPDRVAYDPEKRPEAANLLTLYAAFTGNSIDAATAEYEGSEFSVLKEKLAEATIAHLAPIRERMRDLLGDSGYIDDILKLGAEKARALAEPAIADIRRLVGFYTE